MEKLNNISVQRFIDENDTFVIYVIQTGFQDRFVVLKESGETETIDKVFEGSKIEVEKNFNIKFDINKTEVIECEHDYSDGTGSGYINICKKCGDIY